MKRISRLLVGCCLINILILLPFYISAEENNDKDKGILLPERVIKGKESPIQIKQKKGLQKEMPLFEEERGIAPLPKTKGQSAPTKPQSEKDVKSGWKAIEKDEMDQKKPTERYTLTNFTLYGGNYGEFFGELIHGQQYRKGDILIEGSYHQDNGWRKHMEYGETEGKLSTGLAINDEQRLELNGYAYNRMMNLPGAEDFEKFSSARYTDNSGGELTYYMTINDLNSLKMRLFTDNTHLYDSQREDFTSYNKNGGGFEFNVLHYHPLTFGVEGYTETLKDEYNSNIGSIYFYDNSIPMGDSVNVSLGIEGQSHTDFHGQINPHLAIWGGLTEKTRFNLTLDRKMEPFDFSGHYLKNNFAQIETDQLDPERKWLYRAELSYQAFYNLELKLKLEETEVFDYIASDQDWGEEQRDYTEIDVDDDDLEKQLKRNTDTLWEPVNIDHAIFRGGEVGLVFDMTQDWQYTLRAGYVQALNMENEKVIPYYPELRGYESVRYQGIVNVLVEGSYFGRYYYDKDVNDRVLSDYTLVNARIDKEFLEHLTVFAQGRNLVGYQHEVVKGYPAEPARASGGVTIRF